jgi:SAM-dependent methyltransferase
MKKFIIKSGNIFRGYYAEFRILIEKQSRKKYKEQHQLTSTTHMNRYPVIFSTTKSLIDDPAPKILSFGCSTGEECFSLRSYFPEARIIGADINTKNLTVARKQNNDLNILFIPSDNETLEENGPYDAIFAMSVLCRWEDTKNLTTCEPIYPFSKFEKIVEQLYSLLKNGGLLIVYNANFRVEDTSLAKYLIPCRTDDIPNSGFVHKYSKDNMRLHSEHKSVIYSKVT